MLRVAHCVQSYGWLGSIARVSCLLDKNSMQDSPQNSFENYTYFEVTVINENKKEKKERRKVIFSVDYSEWVMNASVNSTVRDD